MDLATWESKQWFRHCWIQQLTMPTGLFTSMAQLGLFSSSGCGGKVATGHPQANIVLTAYSHRETVYFSVTVVRTLEEDHTPTQS